MAELIKKYKGNDSISVMIFCATIAAGKGGMERVSVELANEMCERGYQVFLGYYYSVEKGWTDPAYEVCKDVKQITWNISNEPLADYREKIIKNDPDTFLAFIASSQLLQYSKFIEGTKIPLIIHEGSNPERIYGVNWAQYDLPIEVAFWERELLASGAARIRLTVPDYKQSFPEYVRKQVRVFPNAVKPAEVLADPSGVHLERKTIINIGGVKQNKNIFPLLQSFSGLASEYPDWDIKIFSFVPPKEAGHKKSIYEFIEIHGLQNRVHILNETSEIYKEYANAQIHAITSLSEGCPTCLCEAMAHRLPSIGFSSCPGVNQFIMHKENGFLVEFEDQPDSLREYLKTLMDSPELRLKMGEQAYKDSFEFEPSVIYDKWEKLFQEAAEYRCDSERLLKEQIEVDSELAMHANTHREKLIREYDPKVPPGHRGRTMPIKKNKQRQDSSKNRKYTGRSALKRYLFFLFLLFKTVIVYRRRATYDWSE